MKKTYISPSITMVKTETESLLDSTSNFNGDGLATGTYETGDQLSKKHNTTTSLWDETWDDPEEDN